MTRVGLLAAVLMVLFSAASTEALAGAGVLLPAVDANPSGQAAVAWSRPDGVRVLTASRAAGTASVTPLARTPQAGRPLVAVDDAGEVIVVWEVSHASENFPCRGCAPTVVSDGVYAALGRVGGAFSAPIRLAGPLVADLHYDRLARPLLRMDATGRAVIAGSDGANSWIATREPGASFSSPQPASKDFVATGLALGRDGETLLTDVRSQVIARPWGGAFGLPVTLPEGNTPFGPGADIAANAAGDAVALYGGYRQVLTSRRRPDGSWGTPVVLSSVDGASHRRVVVATDGTALTTLAQPQGVARDNGHPVAVFASVLSPDGTQTRTQINAPGTDADVDDAPDVDPSGHFLVGFYQVSPLNPARHYVKVLQKDGSAPDATEVTGSSALVESAYTVPTGDGAVLAAWTRRTEGEVLLQARWLPSSTVTTLDRASDPVVSAPAVPKPFLRIIAQPTRHPDRQDRVLIALRCVGQRPCTGTLRLTAGPTRWTAARLNYNIPAGTETRRRVKLSTRATRTLRKQGHLTLTAAGSDGRLRVARQRRVITAT